MNRGCGLVPDKAPGSLHPDWVVAALVGQLEEATSLIAIKESGAWRGKKAFELPAFGMSPGR